MIDPASAVVVGWVVGWIMAGVVMTWLDWMAAKGYLPENPWRQSL